MFCPKESWVSYLAYLSAPCVKTVANIQSVYRTHARMYFPPCLPRRLFVVCSKEDGALMGCLTRHGRNRALQGFERRTSSGRALLVAESSSDCPWGQSSLVYGLVYPHRLATFSHLASNLLQYVPFCASFIGLAETHARCMTPPDFLVGSLQGV